MAEPRSLTFAVAGVPVAMPRPKARAMRLSSGKWTAQVYNPPDADAWKAAVYHAARIARGPGNMHFAGPVSLELMLYFPRIKEMATGRYSGSAIWKETKPDFDNLAKAVCDALTTLGLSSIGSANRSACLSVHIREKSSRE